MEVYASIEKRTKNEDRLKSSLSNEKSLEDMYAKVMKKKKDGEEQQNEAHSSSHSILSSEIIVPSGTFRKPSLVEMNRVSWSSHDSMELQKKESDSAHYATASNNSVGNFHSDITVLKSARSNENADSKNFGVEHGYEAVAVDLPKTNSTTIRESCDPNYETLRSQQYSGKNADYHQSGGTAATAVRNGTDLPTAYTVPFKPRQASNASSEDPGYEKVRLRKRRIEVDQDTDSEPNYESMPHDPGEPNYASVCRPGDSDTDPNYESVNHGDPNYESVKYLSVARTNEEPPYEQVNSYKTEHNRDGYEKVRKQLSNTDYERIYQDHSMDLIDNGDTDDEQYVQV